MRRMDETTIINKLVFEGTLRKELRDETIKVLHVESNSDIKKGTNFLGDIFKVRITYTNLPKSYEKISKRVIDVFVKSEPTDEISLTMVRKQGLFERVLTILEEILPKIEKLLKQQIGPKLLYGSPDLRILIMEDLSKRAFVMKNRQQGLPMEHCLLVIKKLAKLHAGSVALREKDPKWAESFRNGGILSAKCLSSFMRMSEVSLSNVSKTIQSWPDQRCAQIAPKLDKLVKTFRDRCADVYKCEPDEFCVLNHGDCWINNIMFKENDNSKPCDVLMVDYQMSIYSSPAIDLHYFLNICPEIELKYEKDDFFLDTYLTTLRSTMATIGCSTAAPTMEALRAAMHKKRIYAVFAGVILCLRMMAHTKDAEDFTEVLDKLQGETRMDVFQNPDVVKLAEKMIPIMNRRSYFD